MTTPEIDTLLNEKRALTVKLGTTQGEEYSPEQREIDTKRLEEVEAELRAKTQEAAQAQEVETTQKVEEPMDTKKLIKSKRKAVEQRYKEFTEEYVATKVKVAEMKEEKKELIKIRNKLYALKNNESLSPEEQQFVDSVEY